MNTSLTYTGRVDIKLKIRNKIIGMEKHNEGDEWLFKAFAKFVTGNSNTEGDIPKYLDIRESNAGGWVSILTTPVELTRRYFDNDSNYGWTGILHGSIAYENLLSTIPDTSTGNYRIYLISGYDTDPGQVGQYHDLAHTDISAVALSNIAPGVQLLVDWNMSISNS